MLSAHVTSSVLLLHRKLGGNKSSETQRKERNKRSRTLFDRHDAVKPDVDNFQHTSFWITERGQCCRIARVQSESQYGLLHHRLFPPIVTFRSYSTMGLPTKNLQTVAPLLGAILLGWVVELFSLYYLQKSCRLHHTPAWAAGAGFPAVSKCWKLYRFEWLTIWFEFIVVFLIVFTLTKANAIRRFRLAFIGLLGISAVLHILSTNSTLNLQDAKPTSTLITATELLRARIVSGSFAFGAAFSIALLIVLGEDDAPLGSGSEYDAQQPLLQGNDV